MSYTNTWTDNRPLGSGLVSQGDDEFRTLRLDIHERMNSIVKDWTDDPIALKDDLSGAKDGKLMIVPFSAFIGDFADAIDYSSEGRIIVGSTAAPIFAPLIMAPGSIITKIRWLINNEDTNTVTMKLVSVPFSTAVGTSDVHTITSSSSGVSISDSGIISVTYAASTIYFLKADKESGGGTYSIYGVEITYNVPNSQVTL